MVELLPMREQNLVVLSLKMERESTVTLHSQESATDCLGVILNHGIQSAAFEPESPLGG